MGHPLSSLDTLTTYLDRLLARRDFVERWHMGLVDIFYGDEHCPSAAVQISSIEGACYLSCAFGFDTIRVPAASDDPMLINTADCNVGGIKDDYDDWAKRFLCCEIAGQYMTLSRFSNGASALWQCWSEDAKKSIHSED